MAATTVSSKTSRRSPAFHMHSTPTYTLRAQILLRLLYVVLAVFVLVSRFTLLLKKCVLGHSGETLRGRGVGN